MIGVLAGIGAGLGALGSIKQMQDGARQMKQAREAIDNYNRQELANAWEGVGISRMGGDVRRAESARGLATAAQTAARFGPRGFGMLTSGVRAHNLVGQQVAADWDAQRKQLDARAAQDRANIRAMQEAREAADLQGLGQQLAMGQERRDAGMAGLSSTMFNAGMTLAAGGLGQAGKAAGGAAGGSLGFLGQTSKYLNQLPFRPSGSYGGLGSVGLGRSSGYTNPLG